MNHHLGEGAFLDNFPVFEDTLMEENKKKAVESPLSDHEKKAAMNTLAKLHRRTGHPSNNALSNCLTV